VLGKLGNEEASLETWACCFSTDEAWWFADKCFSAWSQTRMFLITWSAWNEDVVLVMFVIALQILSCSLVLAERPLISRFWIGACDVMLWKYVP
jgi:hypothetical protein